MASVETKTLAWEVFGWAMEKDFSLVCKRFWTNYSLDPIQSSSVTKVTEDKCATHQGWTREYTTQTLWESLQYGAGSEV